MRTRALLSLSQSPSGVSAGSRAAGCDVAAGGTCAITVGFSTGSDFNDSARGGGAACAGYAANSTLGDFGAAGEAMTGGGGDDEGGAGAAGSAGFTGAASDASAISS